MFGKRRGPGRNSLTRNARRRPAGNRAPRRTHSWMWISLLVGAVAANTLLALTVPGSRTVMRAAQDALWTYSGVLALVGLTVTTVLGIIATDRVFTTPRQRIIHQSSHRSVALISVGFLFSHVALQISFTRLNVGNALLPFGADAAVVCGILASDLLLVIVVTGVLRGRFAGAAHAWTWRATHLAAYLCWPLALVHGLTAGRAAPVWVVVAYMLCLVAVCAALVLRLVVTSRPEFVDQEAPRADSELLSPHGSTDDELEFWSSMRPGGRP